MLYNGSQPKRLPPCHNKQSLFYGPPLAELDEDGNWLWYDARSDPERAEREAVAKSICAQCEYRLTCLERALVWESRTGAEYGVAGGMSEGERKRFVEHLIEEGYSDIPEGTELMAALRAFTKSEVRKKLRGKEIAS